MSKWTSRVDAYIGGRIKFARVGAGLTLRGLSKLCGNNPGELSNYERGLRSIRVTTLWGIASALKRPVEFFFQDVRKGDEKRKS